jgi:hypothetical protein
MEITQTVPSANPADCNTLDGLNNLLQDKLFLNLKKVCPGIVQSYNKTTNRAVIKPAITGVASQGQKVSKEPLINIPVLKLSGGGTTISFPIKSGDTGWLIACDRNISIFKQKLKESAPNDFRKHQYEDSFFIPDAINYTSSDDFTIANANETFTIADNEITATDFKALNGATGSIVDSHGKILATVVSGIVTEIF